MRTIIHDLNDNELNEIIFNKDDIIMSSLKCRKNCIGCFSCWIKQPKKCILDDDFSNMVDFLKESNELIIISKNRYGCYSASVKKILERCIGYVLPYFTIRNNEIHHESRYKDNMKLSVYFYENMKEEDKLSIERLVKANAINLNANEYQINYISNLKELNKCLH